MKKKPVKKSGPSTGGKVVSRVNEADSKNKKVPVTSVTPKATTAKASKKTMTGARKTVAAAATALPVGRAVKTVQSARAAAKQNKSIERSYNTLMNSLNLKPTAKDLKEYQRLTNRAIAAAKKK
jgi:hypothetical protein